MNVLKYTNNKMHSQLQIMILLHPPPPPLSPEKIIKFTKLQIVLIIAFDFVYAV